MDLSVMSLSLLVFLLLSIQTVESDRVSTGQSSGNTERADGQHDTGNAAPATAGKTSPKHGAGDGAADNSKELATFQRLFLQKRSKQHSAIQDIFAKYNYEQQFKLIELLFDRMTEILVESKEKLAQFGFEPGMPFPTEEGPKEAISLLLENLAFFGDITLQLPDMTHSFYSKKKQLREIVRWGVTFTELTGFFDENHRKLINLMSQELRLIQRDPDYINPFKKEKDVPEPTAPKKKPKKPKKRGPRISKSEL